MKIKFLAPLALILMLVSTSCKENVEVKVPQVDGMLNGAYETVTGSYAVTKDSDGNKVVTVKIKRTNQSVPFSTKTVNTLTQQSDESITLAGFGYVGYDESGNEIVRVAPDNNGYYVDQQLAVLKLNKDATGNLTLVLNSDKLPASIAVTSGVNFVKSGEVPMTGTIGDLQTVNFSIDVDFAQKTLTGKYMYAKTAQYGVYLNFEGDIKKDEYKQGGINYTVDLREENQFGDWSGSFDGSIELTRDDATSPYYYTLKGIFTNYKGKTFQYDFVSQPISD